MSASQSKLNSFGLPDLVPPKGGVSSFSLFHPLPTVFKSVCPMPDVSKDTEIVAVCGIDDGPVKYYEGIGCSAQQHDGWFHSDFYLFKWQLQGTAANQTWITSVDPRHLVNRYGPYHHGTPSKYLYDNDGKVIKQTTVDRRVVLDSSLLKHHDDVKVVQESELKSAYLTAVKQAYDTAASRGTSVLLLVFCHGERIGGQTLMGNRYGPQKLKQQELYDIISPRGPQSVPVTLLATSCFAGRWAVTKPMQPKLNITTLLASESTKVSNSFANFSPTGSYSGGHFASAVMRSMARMELEDLDDETAKDTAQEGITFAGATNLINQILKDDVEYMDVNNSLMFSAQDDEWEMHFEERIGIPMNHFAARWNMLQKAPQQSHHKTSEAWPTRRHGGIERELEDDQFKSHVFAQAQLYLNSFPGAHNAANNLSLHGQLKRWFTENLDPSPEVLESFLSQIDYRSYIQSAANCWAQSFKFDFVDCEQFDLAKFHKSLEDNAAQMSRFKECSDVVEDWVMFDDPDPSQGEPFSKGMDYVAAAAASNGWGGNELAMGLAKRFNGQDIDSLPRTGVSLVPGTVPSVAFGLILKEVMVRPDKKSRKQQFKAEMKKIAAALKRRPRARSDAPKLQLSPTRRSQAGSSRSPTRAIRKMASGLFNLKLDE